MRLDRFITLWLARPLLAVVRPLSSVLGHRFSAPRLPILMYHSISDDPEHGVSPYYQVNTSPSVFRQHMQFFADHGFHTICPDDLVNLLHALHPPRRTPGVTRHAAHLEFPNAHDV